MEMKRFAVAGLLVVLSLIWAANALAADAPSVEVVNAIQRAQAATDQQFNDVSIMLLALRETSDVKSGEWLTLAPALGVVQGCLRESLVWFALPDGSYYTVDGGLMEQSLADREYFPKLLGGAEVIGAVVVGKSSGKRSVIIAEPVFRDGKVIGALGISLFLDGLLENLDRLAAWPDEIGLRILDADGVELTTLGDMSAPAVDVDWSSAISGWQYELLMAGSTVDHPAARQPADAN